MPLLTGVSLSDMLQNSNPKAAYSGTYLTYVRATTALKLGNLAAATDAVLTLPKDSNESRELVLTLFPKLLDAKEYSRAALILQYLNAGKILPSDAMPVGAVALSAPQFRLGRRAQKAASAQGHRHDRDDGAGHRLPDGRADLPQCHGPLGAAASACRPECGPRAGR